MQNILFFFLSQRRDNMLLYLFVKSCSYDIIVIIQPSILKQNASNTKWILMDSFFKVFLNKCVFSALGRIPSDKLIQ